MLFHYQQQHAWPFNILADPKRLAYRSFRLRRLSWFRVYSMATLKLYLRSIRKGMPRENYGEEDIYQGGGDFLLDRAGTILYAHRSQDPADRPSVEKLLREIDAVTMGAMP